MKTLYISDLDGTLLNAEAELDPEDAAQLRRMIGERGLHFSVATARTWETVGKILKDVPLRDPVVLMNGVCVYDPKEKRYIRTEVIPGESVLRVVGAMRSVGVHGFMYRVSEEKLYTYYEALDTPWLLDFYEVRRKKYDKCFTKVEDFAALSDGGIVYFSIFNTREKLDPIYEAVREDPYIKVEYYQDIYSGTLWYLEIGAASTSKAKAVRFLRENGGYDSVVAFGDNQNDLSLFEEADYAVAVANACEAVKERADAIIGRNTEHGVVKYIQRRLTNADGRRERG